MKFIINDQVVLLRAPKGPLAPYIASFSKWTIEQGYARCSLRRRVRIAAGFSQWLAEKSVRLQSVSSRHSVEYLRYRARGQRIREGDATVLRQLLDFLRDQAAAVPLVANWSMSSIPRAIAPDQVRHLLARINRLTAVGRRDYAVLLLLARLGLRSSEVVFLELDDIDRKGGSLSVRGKGGRRLQLPLPTDVGEAIVAYVRHGRPPSNSRRVFLRARAPLRGFLGPSAVGSIVRHALLRAGIDAPTTGAHQFRHGLATEMLRRGASLDEIGELLGHRSPETTKIYTKVDIDALRTLALPWPGGVR